MVANNLHSQPVTTTKANELTTDSNAETKTETWSIGYKDHVICIVKRLDSA